MVATFHLHYLGHRIKYGNLEVGNTTQQLLSTTQPCCSIEFIESFLFWVILVTYNIGIYICIYIYKVSYIHSFLLSSTVMFFLHCMIFIAWSIKWCYISGCSEWVHFPFYGVFFLSRKLSFFWFSCLLLIAELISLDTSGKPTVGFFLKTTSRSLIILSISLELNSID